MGREARFTREELLLAACGEAAMGRPLTIQALASVSGAPVGSIYHRFDSREQLLAEAWLLTVRNFQSAFLPTLQAAATAGQGLAAALTVLRWSRANPTLAALLCLRRQDDFLGKDTPPPLRRAAAVINQAVAEAMQSFATRVERSLLQCHVAVIAIPYGALRLFLPQTPPPPELDDMVTSAYRAIMTRP